MSWIISYDNKVPYTILQYDNAYMFIHLLWWIAHSSILREHLAFVRGTPIRTPDPSDTSPISFVPLRCSPIPSICLRYRSHLSESHSHICYTYHATTDITRTFVRSLCSFHLFIVTICASQWHSEMPRTPFLLFPMHFQCPFHLHFVPL